jgi:hypothetical protein
MNFEVVSVDGNRRILELYDHFYAFAFRGGSKSE